MKILTDTIFAMTATLAFAACNGVSQSPSPAEGLISGLKNAVAEGKFLYAHQDDPVYGHSWKVEDPAADDLSRSDVKSVCGSAPAIVGFDLGGIELGDSANLDGVDFGLMCRAAAKHIEEGGAVTFSWHPRNPLTGGDAWDISSDRVVASVLEGGEKHDMFMGWLSNAADFLETLKGKDGNPLPVIFRPWHENIGSWFWWGGKLCTAEQYKALFALTRNYMEKERGLDNLVWAYSPNSEIDSTAYFSRYPGDEYVDILGVDHYEYVDRSGDVSEEEAVAAAHRHYVAQLASDLEYMANYASARNKLIAVSETGFEGIPYAGWWTDVLLNAVGDAPVAYVLTWRNAWDKPGHYYAPFAGSADSENFIRFRNSGKVLFLDDLQQKWNETD